VPKPAGHERQAKSDDVTDAPDSDPTFTRREQLLEFVGLNRPEHSNTINKRWSLAWSRL
jgi:hypothetical protein